MFETGIIDPSDLQKHLENRKVGVRPRWILEHAKQLSYQTKWD